MYRAEDMPYLFIIPSKGRQALQNQKQINEFSTGFIMDGFMALIGFFVYVFLKVVKMY